MENKYNPRGRPREESKTGALPLRFFSIAADKSPESTADTK